MADPYIGEIRMFAGNFAPLDWSFCNGNLIAISQNEALYNLIGTTYGGDGQTTFALPNLYGRIPLHQGQGPGLANYVLGQSAGTETVTLNTTQLPAHIHQLLAANLPGSVTDPKNSILAQSPSQIYTTDTSTPATMNANALTPAGGSQPHDNMMPYLAVNFIISLYGIYPQQG